MVARAFENVARGGVVVVAAAGNEGLDGVSSNSPAYNSISSPADAPSVIAVGAITNSHAFSEIVTVPGLMRLQISGVSRRCPEMRMCRSDR